MRDVWTQDIKSAQRHGVQWILGKQLAGLGHDCIHFGGNSGYQAINLAYLWGATRIVLLGFDMQRTGGQAHWFGDHPKGKGFRDPTGFEHWLRKFPQLAEDLKHANVEVINCTAASALKCFPARDLFGLE